jgi:hypothetical protein
MHAKAGLGGTATTSTVLCVHDIVAWDEKLGPVSVLNAAHRTRELFTGLGGTKKRAIAVLLP